MNRREFLKTAAFAAIAPSTAAFAKKHAARPNIVFILIDDMGANDMSLTGSTYYETPNIDRLAADGMFFTNAYSAAPVCTPSRGAILSGMYPARTKLTNVFTDGESPADSPRLYDVSKPERGNIQNREALHRHVLSHEYTTFADHLTRAGYATGYAGKWHCGWDESFAPDKHGFTYAEGYRLRPTGTKGHFAKHYMGQVKGMKNLKPDDDMADKLTELATSFIEDNKDKPFMFFLSHYAVHNPQEAKQDVIDKYRAKPINSDHRNPVYAAMIESIDKSVGSIVKKLDDLNLTENTMVVFTSDNGGLTPRSTSNYPLMGGKSFPFEAGMRVPLIVKYPARVSPSQTEPTRTVAVDLYPTFLQAAGIKTPAGLDGISLLPLLTQTGKLGERPIFFHFPHYTHATGPFASVIYKGLKLMRFYNNTSGEFLLFDLDTDPYEQRDLAAKMPEKLAQLKTMLREWQKDTGAQMPRPNPNFDPNKRPSKDMQFTHQKALSERETFKSWRQDQ